MDDTAYSHSTNRSHAVPKVLCIADCSRNNILPVLLYPAWTALIHLIRQCLAAAAVRSQSKPVDHPRHFRARPTAKTWSAFCAGNACSSYRYNDQNTKKQTSFRHGSFPCLKHPGFGPATLYRFHSCDCHLATDRYKPHFPSSVHLILARIETTHSHQEAIHPRKIPDE